ncbi:hypothetical protein [Marinobacterium sp. xm-a-152]|uniref:hypothetical protein n=1 Tax=Marinobacterium sp. xm-a-152 TaxID=2497733 RepID=UPI00156A4D43|nr:hypothetical protein [Marinobacterium sp. xm-a-152]NRP15693.1 hypothetical protein [Marinobacterium sp. xm-a-152]
MKILNTSTNKLLLAILAASLTSQLSHARGPDLPVEFLGGSITLDGVIRDTNENVGDRARDGGHSINIDLGINALGFAGEATINGMWKSADFGDQVFRYGDRMLSGSGLKNAGEQVELYSFQASRLGDSADIHLFYHVPRFHWGYEGDAFGLLIETTNMYDQDIWNEKAPFGVEIVAKNELEGLKILAGKEIYWGAEPMVMAKYQFGNKDQYSLIASTETTGSDRQKQISLQGGYELSDGTTLDLGILWSGAHKVDDTYLYEVGTNVYQDTIKNTDALALKARITEKLSGSTELYTEINYAGLVADAGEHQEIWDTELPYTSQGNKKTVELGSRTTSGNWMFSPRVFYRENLVDAMTEQAQALGTNYQRALAQNDTGVPVSPFAVLGNRKVRAYELFITYDTTPGTFFYDWDNYLKEDAPFAFNLGITHMDFHGNTDSNVMDWGAADAGRNKEKVTKFTGRFGTNPTKTIRLYTDYSFGEQQPVFSDKPVNHFTSIASKIIHNTNNIYSVSYDRNKFGEYDFQSVQGIKFDYQKSFGYERLLNIGNDGSKVGFVAKERKESESQVTSWEVNAYLTYTF